MTHKEKNIIIVSNRLPITAEGQILKKSSGGLVSALEGITASYQPRWIGWPGSHFNDPAEAQAVARDLKERFHFFPVFLSADEITDYYHGFSNACLWPALHYFPQYIRYNSNWWNAYCTANEKFAQEAAKQAKDNDLVWIHDYHLLLAPQILRKINPRLRIGFFLHTPFPSYEVFRCLPHREELLRGLLGSDLIGFHAYGYLRHFRSSITRLLNMDSDIDRIRTEDHFCQLGVFPIGINSDEFLRELKTKRFQDRKVKLRKKYAGQKIVLSIERLDYTKGILRRLEAIEKFLSETGRRGDVSFVIINVPSREEVKEYDQLKEMIEQAVGRINGNYGTVDYVPINFIHSSVSFTELCALYAIADVALVTPLIDGMNLVAKEFLVCQDQNAGVLLLSEFTGAANELFNAVIVNPYHIDNIVESLKKALSMSASERQGHVKDMRAHVLRNDAKYWAKTFLQSLSQHAAAPESEKPADAALSATAALKKIQTAASVAFFIDYDGTLREFESVPSKASPTKEIRELLSEMAEIKNFRTFIISGRKHVDLDIWLGDLKNITLVSEHGFSFRAPGKKRWQPIHANLDLSFREKVLEIFQQHVNTTPGSFIEVKEAALVWHYRQSDPEFGLWKAQHLIVNLQDMLVNRSACVHHGKCIVEVSPAQIHKGAAVNYFLQKNPCDLVVCAGDDRTDETMFALEDPRIISIKISKGETRGQLRLSTPHALRDFLKSACSTRQAKDSGGPHEQP